MDFKLFVYLFILYVVVGTGLSPYHVGIGDQTQVVRLGNRHLYPLNHL